MGCNMNELKNKLSQLWSHLDELWWEADRMSSGGNETLKECQKELEDIIKGL